MGRVADLLVEALAQAGVRRVYGIAGDSLNALTESLRKRHDIAWVHVRHEEVAAFAAGAEAHLTGSLAVCAGSCGPGNLHLINGLYDPADLADAMRDILAHDGPALLDVVTPRQELAMPPKICVEQAMGFGLWLAKAVINGRGTEIIDLARTNLSR